MRESEGKREGAIKGERDSSRERERYYERVREVM